MTRSPGRFKNLLIDLAVRYAPLTPRTSDLASRYMEQRVRTNCSLSEIVGIELAILRIAEEKRRQFFRILFFRTMGVHYLRRFLEIGDLPSADSVAETYMVFNPETGEGFVRTEFERFLTLAPWVSETVSLMAEQLADERVSQQS